ncbi:helix-turn-helix transcriptional regulator [Herbaspirillum sp. GCM10030257]|uniref:helix-turn-helix transcriptional regulator n=1 Tax=Herbaspirillum sp. GCM10030257 TaxID=3273393 RepID=UPI0036102734
MQLAEIGRRIGERRTALQLTQAQLARLAGLSRLTINQLEAGKLKDLGAAKLISLLHLLGLSLDLQDARPHRGLLKASISASVSYQHEMTPAQLAEVLTSGELPDELEAPVATLLDETPLSVVVQAVEEAAATRDVPPRQIWKHLAVWSRNLHLYRQVWQ